jgi:hypothetical protein
VRFLALGVTIALIFVLARPHVVRHWGLYVVSNHGESRTARLFLDPFPDQVACELRRYDLEAQGAEGLCKSSLDFEWGTTVDRSLASDFSRTNVFLYDMLCAVRGVPTTAVVSPRERSSTGGPQR